ncbi:centrosomal protein of 104 kDa isoform X2 [Pangasianodon hypophthalmus]|uniref:centrosomal protein of 104 kDa isoform X2 n=1 Tax=Pangasianodon hypophthalmus TaxID=310915 RepID=UPI00147B270F|nr:centrosomal protein of 104 kDa isoform X2 [Pangasianodon hypophthalmus]
MPRKIGFTVISWSGHEENYSARELMVHAPTINGWRSDRFCQFPQEITLQMVERCRIRKLQLLAHQYLISSKVEFHIGDREQASPQRLQQFRRLGYVSLSTNEKTGFRARELKSVHVDAVGTYLKLTFHKNHVNQYNIYNQPSSDQLIDQYISGTQHSSSLDGSYAGYKHESISPLDDLAFDMYQDPEVAHIIRLLDDKKQEMVRLERYHLAKKLKQAIADLQKVGECLGRYDVEKHSAIEREDYDTAKQKKEQMDAYRLRVYQQLELHDLLDMGQIQRMTENVSDCSIPSPSIRPLQHSMPLSETPKKKNQEQSLVEDKQITPKPTSHEHTSAATPHTPPHFPKIDVSSMPYDERPLPALRKRSESQPQPQAEQMLAPLDPSSPRSPGVTGEPEPLSEKAQREAVLPIEVYGDSLVAGAYSKTWSYREDSLLAVYKKLAEVSPGTPKAELMNMMRAAVFLCKKALTDKVSSVFQASLKLLRMILKEFVSSHQLGRSEISYCVEHIWPSLLSRTGESTVRLRTLAIAFIQEMAVYKEVHALQLIPIELVKPIKSSIPARLALSRLELLEKLLEQLGTNDSGFTLDNVMRFLAGALEHCAASVRELAVRIVQTMYHLHGRSILSYLPPDDPSTRKNILYKHLFDSFAKTDGRLPQSQVKKGRVQKEGEKEEQEIKSLQEQLAVLKEISEKGKEKNKTPERKTEKPPKPGVKKGTHSICTDGKGGQSIPNYLDNLCIFCGEKDKSFTEDGLDLHYWKHCPMLCRCLQCRQVVEIASLTEHLLSECEHKADFTQCPHCSEAISRNKLTEHAQSTSCNPLPDILANGNCNHCPLCHENFPPGEEGWKFHLMDSSAGCKQNTRRIVALQRAKTHTQGKTIGGAAMKPAAVESVGKGRSGGRSSSRIPAPAPRPSRTSKVKP